MGYLYIVAGVIWLLVAIITVKSKKQVERKDVVFLLTLLALYSFFEAMEIFL